MAGVLVADKWDQHWWGRCKSHDFDRLYKKVRPGTFGKTKVGLTGVPKKSLCQNNWNLQWPHECWPHLSLSESPAMLQVYINVYTNVYITLYIYIYIYTYIYITQIILHRLMCISLSIYISLSLSLSLCVYIYIYYVFVLSYYIHIYI